MKTLRRDFLTTATALGFAGLAAAAPVLASEPSGPESAKMGAKTKQAQKPGEKPGGGEAEEVSAPEDLMREHGVLRRILLIFEECRRRLRSNKELKPEALHQSAILVRDFVEDYHEKLEEDFIFPLFEKRRELIPLVRVLRRQHQAGRSLTETILTNSTPERFANDASRQEISHACWAFIRMYRPHAAREDTVLFPALHGVMSEAEMDKLGDRFEEEENRRFGKEGFEHTVEKVAAIEKQLGIFDLDRFTPKARTAKS